MFITTIGCSDTNDENDNITEVIEKSDEDYQCKTTVHYVLDKVVVPINNIGSIMFLDDTSDIDLDKMQYAYYAGLLGKPTKHLPIKYQSVRNNGYRSEEGFHWDLNVESYPINQDEYVFSSLRWE